MSPETVLRSTVRDHERELSGLLERDALTTERAAMGSSFSPNEHNRVSHHPSCDLCGGLTPKFSCERHAVGAQHYLRAAGATPEGRETRRLTRARLLQRSLDSAA
jgi:hypothetical protein